MVCVLVDLYPISGAHNTRPVDRMRFTESQDAADWTPQKMCLFWHTTAFVILDHINMNGYERKNVAVVSVKRHQLQGDFVS